jgi:hypothetical protein
VWGSNADWAINVSDAIYLINYIFAGGNPPDPMESGDADCSGGISVSDAVMIIRYIFVGGNKPCDINAMVSRIADVNIEMTVLRITSFRESKANVGISNAM